MSSRPARFTQADLNRAAKVAVAHGMRVRVDGSGDIILEPYVHEINVLAPKLDERPDYAL